MSTLEWNDGRWTHPPVAAEHEGGALVVTAAEGSDAWRRTSYGFVHDSEHALVAPLPVGAAMEVDFVAAFEAQFDQAGLFVTASDERWVKAGVEYADGAPQAGAVVTDGMSDWSVAPVPDWQGRLVTVRASRGDDAITLRIGVDGGPLRLLRLLPFPGDLAAEAGPFACAPTRAGLRVEFRAWRLLDADAALH